MTGISSACALPCAAHRRGDNRVEVTFARGAFAGSEELLDWLFTSGQLQGPVVDALVTLTDPADAKPVMAWVLRDARPVSLIAPDLDEDGTPALIEILKLSGTELLTFPRPV